MGELDVRLGVLLERFVRCVDELAAETRVDLVAYFTREGELFFRAHERLASVGCSRFQGARLVLPASRRVLAFANVRSVEDVLELAAEPMARASLTKVLVDRFQLDEALVSIRLAELGIEGERAVHRHDDWGVMERALRALAPEIVAAAGELRRSLRCYYESLGLVTGRRVLVVDIGYRGSLQHHLTQLLGDDVYVTGCYLAGRLDALRPSAHSVHLFSGFVANDILAQNVVFLEFLCMADHGTMTGLDSTAGFCRPVWGAMEAEEDASVTFAKDLQRRALDRIGSVRSAESCDTPDTPDALVRWTLTPRDSDEVRQLVAFGVEDAFGARRWRPLVPPLLHQDSRDLSLDDARVALAGSAWPLGALCLLRERRLAPTSGDRQTLSRRAGGLHRRLGKLLRNPGAFLLDSRYAFLRRLGHRFPTSDTHLETQLRAAVRGGKKRTRGGS